LLIARIRFKLAIMFRLLTLISCCFLAFSAPLVADDGLAQQHVEEPSETMAHSVNSQAHTYIEAGVIYCDAQTFNREAYILNVIGSGSALTVFWQFKVMKKVNYWLDDEVVNIRLGRQVIPDLVTKRWLMRDLSGGVVHYTTDAHQAMVFLTEMNHVGIVDLSVLEDGVDYELSSKLFLHEGEDEEQSWMSSMFNWGEDIDVVPLKTPLRDKVE